MFEIDGKTILVEVETDVYVLNVILGALPAMAGCVWRDETLKRLYEEMQARVDELYSDKGYGQDIEDMLVVGYG
jgi:hypothetical protein